METVRFCMMSLPNKFDQNTFRLPPNYPASDNSKKAKKVKNDCSNDGVRGTIII